MLGAEKAPLRRDPGVEEARSFQGGLDSGPLFDREFRRKIDDLPQGSAPTIKAPSRVAGEGGKGTRRFSRFEAPDFRFGLPPAPFGLFHVRKGSLAGRGEAVGRTAEGAFNCEYRRIGPRQGPGPVEQLGFDRFGTVQMQFLQGIGEGGEVLCQRVPALADLFFSAGQIVPQALPFGGGFLQLPLRLGQPLTRLVKFAMEDAQMLDPLLPTAAEVVRQATALGQ